MNGVSKGLIAFFGGAGIIMVLVSRELKERGGDVGAAALTFNLIGMIWTAVAIFLLVLFLIISRATARTAARQAEAFRKATGGSDGTA